MNELSIADRFYIDGNPSLTSVELASILGKSSASVEAYIALKAQKEYEQGRRTLAEQKSTQPANSPDTPTSIPNSQEGKSSDVVEKKPEVIQVKKSPLRDAFARRGNFTAMTSSAGMMSDEIARENGTPNILDREGITTATGR